MAGKTKQGFWRISYTLEKKRRREISLSGDFDRSVVSEFERLLHLLVDHHRFGNRLPQRDREAVERLPLVLRQKLVEAGLIERTADETIPLLFPFLEEYAATRKHLESGTILHDKRICNYLRESFGNIRLDRITPADAAKIRGWLTKDRSAGRGTLGKSSVNRAITGFKTIFRFAVESKYLVESEKVLNS